MDCEDSGGHDGSMSQSPKKPKKTNKMKKVSSPKKRMASTIPDSDSASDTEPEDENGHGNGQEEEEEDEQFEFPTEFESDEQVGNKEVSKEHKNILEKLKANKIIGEDVYNVMAKMDFFWFYNRVTPEWAEHNAVVLERLLPYIQKGQRILFFPLNTYLATTLAKLVGPRGGVITFGHKGNVRTLVEAGFESLWKNYQIRFTNNRFELFYGRPTYMGFLEGGFPALGPYDLIVATDTPYAHLYDQMKPGGFVLRPDIKPMVKEAMDTFIQEKKDLPPTPVVAASELDVKPKEELKQEVKDEPKPEVTQTINYELNVNLQLNVTVNAPQAE